MWKKRMRLGFRRKNEGGGLLGFNLAPPVIIIALVSMFVSFVVSLASRLLIKRERMEVWRKEMARLKAEIEKVRKSRDKRSLEKLKRLQTQMLSIQSKASMQSMKVMPVSLVVYFIIWGLILVPTYASVWPVALLPGLFGTEPLKLGLFEWYFLCSILFGILFNKAFGLSMGGD